MRILITGGAGFIGGRLAFQLKQTGHEVTILDCFSEQVHGDKSEDSDYIKSLNGCAEVIKGDVRDEKLLAELMKCNEVIVHLAAETGTGQSMYQIKHYTDVNIQATASMMDILTNNTHTIEKVIVASSRAIYGEGQYVCPDHGVVSPDARLEADLLARDYAVKCPICRSEVELIGTKEDSSIKPTSIYGITKQVQEQLVMISGESIGMPVTALRYQNVYGPGQSLKNPYTGILSIFSTAMLNNNPISVFEDGLESRDFVYIDDVIKATVMAIENDAANGQILNVGSGVPITVLEVVELLTGFYDTESTHTVSHNFRLGDIRHNYADLSKIADKLGYAPSVSFQQGVEQFSDWVKTQRIEEDNYSRSLDELSKKGLFK